LYCVTGSWITARRARRHGYDEARREEVTAAVDETEFFEAERPRLHAAAFRMLGSAAEAQDAVQEAWLRYRRVEFAELENPAAWLLTVVGRICLDLLRSRKARRESPAAPDVLAAVAGSESVVGSGVPGLRAEVDPVDEAVLVESVGRALLVVLARLGAAERIAFVLHDLFAVPFDEIAVVVGRTPSTTKKLASRARQRVRGTAAAEEAVDLAWHRSVVEAFLAAARGRDIDGLLAVLDPDVVRTADLAAVPAGARLEIRGAQAVVEETLLLWRNAQNAAVALVDGRVGLVVAPNGRLRSVITLTFVSGRITEYSVIADPSRLAAAAIAVLD
jgi:RNA polymerase sigma factor (sigma-70 family)